MQYEECLEWLYGQLPMYQRIGRAAYKADLKNTEALMAYLGHPESQFDAVHIGGTNGKGSVAHMLAAIFQQAGYRTGLYTSPHLKDFRERIRLNGELISREEVVAFVSQHKDELLRLGLSFFEMTVGLAYHYFARERVDMALVEVGMGGRLDSTNVIVPQLSIITNISLDHTSYLGDTRALIAREKAGIIKAGIPVVIGERHPDTDAIFTEVAREKKAPLHFAEDEISWRQIARLDLDGPYQDKNLRTVLCACRVLEQKGYRLENHLDEALSRVKELTGLRGRWEVIGDKPRIICDTGHNEAGIAIALDQLKKESFRQLHIVWGMVNDKDINPILRMMPKSAIYYFCRPDIPRGREAEELKRGAVRFGLSGKSYPSVKEALQAARQNTLADDLIFVGGSTFVVAEVL